MKYRYEGINHNPNLPVKIFIHSIKRVTSHWHEELELLFVLKGRIAVRCGVEKKLLNETDIFVINGNSVHATEADCDNLVLALQIKRDYFATIDPRFTELYFACDSTADTVNRELYNRLRSILARLMNVINKQEDWYLFSATALLNRLCYELAKNFSGGSLDRTNSIDHKEDKLRAIIDYVALNYQNDIGLTEVAAHLHLNKDYLSRYFSKYMGISLAKYITDIRLKKSINLLADTEQTITEIAYDCGFALPKSYFSAFRKAYHTTPLSYRKTARLEPERFGTEFDYLNIDLQNSFEILYQFLPPPGQPESGGDRTDFSAIEIKVADFVKETAAALDPADNPGIFINHSCKIGCFGRAAEGLRADWQAQFRLLQEEIGFEYMRFHGIFHDDMMIYHETEQGVAYDFTYVDQLLDFLLAHRARPFIELGFMPRQLASDDTKVFWWGGNASAPNDMAKWLNLIEVFIRHLLNRYGRGEVRQWYFEIWNEPDLSAFWGAGRDAYFAFFRDTFTRIKQVEDGLRVGGFSLASCHIGDMFDYLAERCRAEGLIPDFFTYHAYPFKTVNPLELSAIKNSSRSDFFPRLFDYYYRRGEPDYLEHYSRDIKEKAAAAFPGLSELFITEFNASFYPRELILDTCYMAAFLVKNLLYFNRHTNGAGYWTFTDIFEEMPTVSAEFHGGFGLMSRHGIRKPHYYAYRFFRRLGGQILYEQDGCIATLSAEGHICILFYYYVHLDQLYSRMDTSGITPLKRDNCFESASNQHIECSLTGLTGNYCLTEQRIAARWGSAFDKWVEMGGPVLMNAAEIAYLSAVSQPQLKSRTVTAAGEINLTVVLEPHNVVLYELSPQC